MALGERDFEEIGRTADRLVKFGLAVQKIKVGASADANIQLTRNECRALIWGMQLLRTGDGHGQRD